MPRPRKDPAERRVDLRMRVPPDLKAAVERAAAKAGQSVTAWMEGAARERIAREAAGDAPGGAPSHTAPDP